MEEAKGRFEKKNAFESFLQKSNTLSFKTSTAGWNENFQENTKW